MRNIKILTGVLTALTLLFGLTASAQEQEREPEYKAQRTNKIGLYLKGGTAWTLDGGNGQSSSPTWIFGGAGVNWNFRPWVRVGLNYDYTCGTRNQYFTELQPVDMDVNGTGGMFYRQFRNSVHGVDVTGEFNIMELFHNRTDKGWFNIYAGTGFGWAFGAVNIWSMSTGHNSYVEKAANGSTSGASATTWFKALNDKANFNTPYIPAKLSVEFHVLPQISVGLEGVYKFLCKKSNLIPRHLLSAGITLRFILTGKINCRKCEEKDVRYQELSNDYAEYQKKCAQAKAEKDEQIKALTEANDSLRAQLEDCRSSKVEVVEKSHVVYFGLDSSNLSDVEKERLMEFAAELDAEDMISIIGEASNEGSSEYNLKLSDQRVQTVVAMLKELGIGYDRICSAKGIGSSEQNNGPAYRRVSITICE